MTFSTLLSKMTTSLSNAQVPVYSISSSEDPNQVLAISSLIGQEITIAFEGKIHCIACKRAIKKSLQQGYCFPCTQKLAECDICIVRPELCHLAKGTCRDPLWAESHCQIPHTVYLAFTSGYKVGITRKHHQISRWIDQGAVAAVPLATTTSRYHSGLIESALAKSVPDKTNWRGMLKHQLQPHDILAVADQIASLIPNEFPWEKSAPVVQTINYHVDQYPPKINSLNLDKTPTISGVLRGIKGQYLIFDYGVISMRKFAGYQVKISFAQIGQGND